MTKKNSEKCPLLDENGPNCTSEFIFVFRIFRLAMSLLYP